MKKSFSLPILFAIILLVAIFSVVALGLYDKMTKPALPVGAVKIQEKGGVTLYAYHDAKGYKDWLDTGNSVYLVNGRKILTTIKLHYHEQVAIESVYKNRIILVSYPISDSELSLPVHDDRVFHTNRAEFYVFYRDSGILQAANFHDDRSGGRLVGAAQDGSLLIFSNVSQSEDGHFYPHLTTFSLDSWENFEHGFFDMPLSSADDAIDDVSCSPDGSRAAIVIEDTTKSDQQTARARLYLLDMTRTESVSKKADLSMPTDQMWLAINGLGYSGTGTAFAGSIVGWNSPTSVRVTTSPGRVETFSVR